MGGNQKQESRSRMYVNTGVSGPLTPEHAGKIVKLVNQALNAALSEVDARNCDCTYCERIRVLKEEPKRSFELEVVADVLPESKTAVTMAIRAVIRTLMFTDQAVQTAEPVLTK